MSQKPPHPQHTAELPLSDAWRALSALCVGFFMILLDQTIVAVATPHFHKDLDASLNDVIWVTSVYLLTFAVPLLVTGRLGDRFGQRTIYLIGMVVFTLSSLACGLASTIELLIIARALQGFGASLIAPQTMSVINRIFPRDKRGAAMGMWGAVAGFASLMGPLLGGVIVAYVGWQWIFFINVPIGVVSLVLVARWVPVLPRASRSIDALSVVASVISVFAFVFTLQEGPHLGWPLWLWGLLAAGVCLVCVATIHRCAPGYRASGSVGDVPQPQLRAGVVFYLRHGFCGRWNYGPHHVISAGCSGHERSTSSLHAHSYGRDFRYTRAVCRQACGPHSSPCPLHDWLWFYDSCRACVGRHHARRCRAVVDAVACCASGVWQWICVVPKLGDVHA